MFPSSSSSSNRRLPVSILFHQPPNPLHQQHHHPTLSNNLSSSSSRTNSPGAYLSSSTTSVNSSISTSLSSLHISTPSFSSSNSTISTSNSLNSPSFSSSSSTNPLKTATRSRSNSNCSSNSISQNVADQQNCFVTSPTGGGSSEEMEESGRKRTKSMALAKQLKKISNQANESPIIKNDSQQQDNEIPSSDLSNRNSQKESTSETLVVGLKRRMSSFLFRKSLNQETLTEHKSFRISTSTSSSPLRKSLNISNNETIQTASAPQFGNDNSSKKEEELKIQRRNSKTRSFFTSKKKKQLSMDNSSSHSTSTIGNNNTNNNNTNNSSTTGNFKKNRNSSNSNVSNSGSNGGMAVNSYEESPETPSTSSVFSFVMGGGGDMSSSAYYTNTTSTATGDNLSNADVGSGGADCISNYYSGQGGNQKSLVLEDLEHSIPDEMGNIDSMRVKFLQFISNEFVRNSNTKGLPENDYLVKLYFMDFMYDGISAKISRKLTTLSSILNQIDLLCKFLLTKFDKHSQLWREIIEDQASSLKYPYLECIVTDTIENDAQRMSQSCWLTHQRLQHFLKETYQVYVVKNQPQPPIAVTEQQPTATAAVSPTTVVVVGDADQSSLHSTTVTATEDLKKQIQLLCDMFFIDLEDQFMLFQAKNYKYIKKWISEGVKNKILPNQVIEIYKKDKEHNEKMQNEFKIQAEDFTTKHVIDKDWKFMKYFSNELSHHWFLTYSQVGKLMNWNSFADFSSDNLNLRISKMIGYIDEPIEQVVKSFNNDNHLQYQFKNMKWSSYNNIDDSNSLLKYPSVLMSGVYESGSLFSSRNMQLVFSSKSSFVGDELTEMQTLFKSCETVSNSKEKAKKDIIKIKMPLLGVRILLKIDENRTRVTELRFSNLGGFLNSKIVIFNPISSKKSCLETYNSMLSTIASHEGKGMPSVQDNNLMRLWVEYCKHYTGIDVIEKYKSLR